MEQINNQIDELFKGEDSVWEATSNQTPDKFAFSKAINKTFQIVFCLFNITECGIKTILSSKEYAFTASVRCYESNLRYLQYFYRSCVDFSIFFGVPPTVRFAYSNDKKSGGINQVCTYKWVANSEINNYDFVGFHKECKPKEFLRPYLKISGAEHLPFRFRISWGI